MPPKKIGRIIEQSVCRQDCQVQKNSDPLGLSRAPTGFFMRVRRLIGLMLRGLVFSLKTGIL